MSNWTDGVHDFMIRFSPIVFGFDGHSYLLHQLGILAESSSIPKEPDLPITCLINPSQYRPDFPHPQCALLSMLQASWDLLVEDRSIPRIAWLVFGFEIHILSYNRVYYVLFYTSPSHHEFQLSGVEKLRRDLGQERCVDQTRLKAPPEASW